MDDAKIRFACNPLPPVVNYFTKKSPPRSRTARDKGFTLFPAQFRLALSYPSVSRYYSNCKAIDPVSPMRPFPLSRQRRFSFGVNATGGLQKMEGRNGGIEEKKVRLIKERLNDELCPPPVHSQSPLPRPASSGDGASANAESSRGISMKF